MIRCQILRVGDSAHFQYGTITTTITMDLIRSFCNNWMNFCSSSQAILTSSTKVRCRDAISEGILLHSKSLSALLFGAKGVPQAWFRAKGIQFLLDEEMAVLPFEILARDGLMLSDCVPVLRVLNTNTAFSNKRLAGARDFLACGSPRHAHAPEELSEIEGMRKRKGWSYVSSAHLGRQKIMTRLLGAKRFHYAGHSCFDHIDLAEGERLDGDALALLDLSGLELAFLNSCRSACLRDGENRSGSSLLRGMLESGVAEIIGYGGDVVAAEAVVAAGYFWDEIERGTSAGRAVFLTRKRLREAFGSGCLSSIMLQHYCSATKIPKNTHPMKLVLAAGICVFVVLLAGNFHFSGRIKPAEDRTRVLSAASANTRGDLAARVSLATQEASRPDKPGPAIKVSLQTRPVLLDTEKRSNANGFPNNQVSEDLSRVIEEFIKFKHPLLNREQRIDLVRALLNEPMPDKARIVRLRSEMRLP